MLALVCATVIWSEDIAVWYHLQTLRQNPERLERFIEAGRGGARYKAVRRFVREEPGLGRLIDLHAAQAVEMTTDYLPWSSSSQGQGRGDVSVKPRLVVLGAATGALLVLVTTGVLLKARIVEEYYLWRLRG